MSGKLLDMLKGGDLRSIGKANEIVKLIGDDQLLFDEVFHRIWDTDPVVRMRSSDVIEKVSKKYPHLIMKNKRKVINSLGDFTQQEVKWHIALILSYMEISEKEFPTLALTRKL